MHQSETITSTELADLLGLSHCSIHSTLVRRPDRLPPPIRIPGASRLIWLKSDVYSWLDQFKTKPATRRRGRPLKQPSDVTTRSELEKRGQQRLTVDNAQ